MQLWLTRIENSPALEIARQIKDDLASSEVTVPEDEDYRLRNLRIAEVAEWTLTNADPRLISDSVLNSLINHLGNARTHIGNWKASGSSDYLRAHALQELESALTWLSNIPVQPEAAAAQEEIGSLRRSVGQHRGAVEREMEQLRSEVATAREDWARRTAESAAKTSEVGAQVAAYREEITALGASAREQANQQQSAFGSAELERQTAFTKLLEEKRAEFAEVTTGLKAQFHQDLQDAQATAVDSLEEIEGSKKRVEAILEIVGEEALVGTYSLNATKELKQANRWRLVAVMAAIVTVAIGVWLVISTHESTNTDWDGFAAKIVLALPVGGVAAYAGRQSAEHRHAQRDAEHIALQLTALGPYLNNLSDRTDRDELLKEIARRLFGQPRTAGPDAAAELFAANPGLLGQILSSMNGKT